MFSHIDFTQWVITLGYIGLIAIVFAETGLFFGFFLPGDSLLFTAGLLASQKIFNIGLLVPALIAAAIAGYQLGYWYGSHLGRWLLKRKDSIWFKRAYLQQAQEFYDRHGAKALLLARMMPIVRTFVPIVAGMVHMTRKKYFMLNLIGAVIWGGGVTLLGYFLGASIPDANKYILPIVVAIIFLSILPGIIRFSCQYRRRS